MFGPVDAVRANTQGELRVGGDQELQTPAAAEPRQSARGLEAIRRSEVAIHNGRSRRQARRCRERVGRARRVGEKVECGNGRGPALAVETPRQPR